MSLSLVKVPKEFGRKASWYLAAFHWASAWLECHDLCLYPSYPRTEYMQSAPFLLAVLSWLSFCLCSSRPWLHLQLIHSFLRGLNFFFFCLSQHLLYYYICWKRPWFCALVAEFSCFVLVIRVVFLYPTAILKLLRLYAFDRFAGGIKHLFSHAAHELKSKIFITDFKICSSHNLFKGKKCLPLPTIVVCWNCLKLSHMFALYIQFW